MNDKLKPCPKCNKSWLYVSDGDYYSDYESNGYREIALVDMRGKQYRGKRPNKKQYKSGIGE